MSHNNINLVASIAVFAELCDTEKNIRGIISEFIKSVYVLEKQQLIDSTEMTLLLKKHFDFDLPEAVVMACMKGSGFLEKETRINSGKYCLKDKSYNNSVVSDRLNSKKEKQRDIENELILYVQKRLDKKLLDYEKAELVDAFVAYLIEKGGTDKNFIKYSAIISSFIMDSSNNDDFVSELNKIKEGSVLLTGLRYTNDLNNIGSWNDELVIYLDTELLFNAQGLNGEVHQRLFNDFFSLIQEVNESSYKRFKKKLIHLKYFTEVKKEIDDFFYAAEKIVDRHNTMSPENSAMETICKGCDSTSDILYKKALFEKKMISMGILLQEDLDYYSSPQYNIEGQYLGDSYTQYDDDEVSKVLKSFTKVNYHRRGINNTSFEKCGHVILTGKKLSLNMSRDLEVKNGEKDIPFSTNIYFITNRLWYRLNKGLSKSVKLPATLDVIVKAQVVLSSQIHNSIHDKYAELSVKLKKGEMTVEAAQSWYYSLREKAKKPEDIKRENIEESLDFILESDLEKYQKEQSMLRHRAQIGDDAVRKLQKIEFLTARKAKQKWKILANGAFFLLKSVFMIVLILLPLSIFYGVSYVRDEQDTRIGIISFVITIVLELLGLFKFITPIFKWIRTMRNAWYRRLISK